MRNLNKIFIVVFAVVFALFFASASQAQELPFGIDNVPNIAGVGVAMLPDYAGSDDYMAGVAPFFKYTPENTNYYAILIATELSINVVNHPTFRFGPVVNYRFGRNDDVEDDVVKNMEEIDGAFEAGAFVGYDWKDSKNPLHRFGVSLQFLGDVSGEYNGYLISATAKYWLPVHKMAEIGFVAGTSYADSHYMKKYFGVSQKDSDATELAVFKTGNGMRDVRVGPAVVLHFSPQWHAGIGVRYQYLLEDAQDSPVVKDRGDENQWIYGLAVAYAW